jgi:hypothetical protein
MPSWPDFSKGPAGDSGASIVPDLMKKLTPESSFYSIAVLPAAVA